MTKQKYLEGYRGLVKKGTMSQTILNCLEQAWDFGWYEGNQNGLKVANEITDMVTNSLKK